MTRQATQTKSQHQEQVRKVTGPVKAHKGSPLTPITPGTNKGSKTKSL